MMELTQAGKSPLELPGGEKRSFLEDGDEVIERGRCERAGAVPIGFGEARGRILPTA
jgi:fumarylacetoacetase